MSQGDSSAPPFAVSPGVPIPKKRRGTFQGRVASLAQLCGRQLSHKTKLIETALQKAEETMKRSLENRPAAGSRSDVIARSIYMKSLAIHTAVAKFWMKRSVVVAEYDDSIDSGVSAKLVTSGSVAEVAPGVEAAANSDDQRKVEPQENESKADEKPKEAVEYEKPGEEGEKPAQEAATDGSKDATLTPTNFLQAIVPSLKISAIGFKHLEQFRTQPQLEVTTAEFQEIVEECEYESARIKWERYMECLTMLCDMLMISESDLTKHLHLLRSQTPRDAEAHAKREREAALRQATSECAARAQRIRSAGFEHASLPLFAVDKCTVPIFQSTVQITSPRWISTFDLPFRVI